MCLKIQLLIKHSLLFIILFLLTPNSLFSIDTKNRRPPVDLTKSSWYIKEGFSENYIKSENFNISEYQEFKEFPLVLNKIFKNPSGNIQLKEYTLICPFQVKENRIIPGRELALFLSGIGEAWEIYLNGELVKNEFFLEAGNIKRYKTVRNYSIPLPFGILKKENHLVIRLAGYTPPALASQNVLFGLRYKERYFIDYEKEINEKNQQYPLFILNSIYIFFGLYHLFFFIRWPQKKYNIYFAIFSLSISTYFLTFSNILFNNLEDTYILFLLGFTVQPIALTSFILFLHDYFLPEERINLPIKISIFSSVLIVLSFFYFKIYYFYNILYIWYLFAVFQLIYVFYFIIKSLRQGFKDSIPMAMSILIMMVAVIWEMLDTIIFQTGLRVLQFAYFSFILSLVLILANRFIEINWETKRLNIELTKQRDSFIKFVPMEFLEVLGKSSASEIIIGECKLEEMTILFVDIREFTNLSESMTPEENFRFINSYLRRMSPVIEKNKGFIDKFIGDAIMAIFKTPDNAVHAANEMMEELKEFNLGRKRAGYKPIKVGIGINTGKLMMGTVGYEDRFNTTAIGDAVNLSARLESITKIYGTPILISEETYNKLLNPNDFNLRPIDLVNVKGKSNKVKIYECFDLEEEPIKSKKIQTLELINNAILLMENKKNRSAVGYWKKILKIYPEDPIANFHLSLKES